MLSRYNGILVLGSFIFILSIFVFFANGYATVVPNGKLSSDPTSLDLNMCIKMGLEKNPRIKALKYEVKKAEADLMAAKSDFFPQLSLSAFRERIDSIRASGPTDSDYEDQFVDGFDLRISQVLFAGLSVVNSYKRAELYKELVMLQKEQTTLQLILEIVTTYFELIKAKKDVETYMEAVKNLELNLKYAKALYEKRLITKTDVLNSEVDLANMKTKLSQAKAQVSIYRDNLKTLIGLNPDIKISFLEPKEDLLWEFTMSLDDCVNHALLARHEIKIAQKKLEIAKKEKDIIGARLIPSVNLTVDYYKRGTSYDEMGMSYLGPYDRDQKNTYWIGQINVYWTLGRGGRSIFEAKKAIYEIERLKKDIEDIKDQVTTQVRNYYLSVKEAKERILFTKKALFVAKENYNQASKRFKLLVGGITEVLNAQARLTRAEQDLNEAIFDYNISLVRLYYSMGKLSENIF